MMSIGQESPAVATALAHCEAWSKHDWNEARRLLASDVRVTATTTRPTMPETNLTGVDAYMEGLQNFAGAIVPGSLQVNATVGDERNALLMVTVQAGFGPGGTPVPLPGARLYLLDDQGKIKVEQVVFFVPG
jgi:SnoaL-like domain